MLWPAPSTTSTLASGRRCSSAATSSSSTTLPSAPPRASRYGNVGASASMSVHSALRSKGAASSPLPRRSYRQRHVPSGWRVALWRMPRRSEDSVRVGLYFTVRSKISVKLGKSGGPSMNSWMCLAFSLVTPGVTSTTTRAGTRWGWRAARALTTSPPSDMPTTRRASGAERPHRLGDVVGHVAGRVGAVVAPGRVTVAGQVDGDGGKSQRQDHRVPGVGVLAGAVHEDHLGRLAPPHEDAQVAPVGERTRSPAGPAGATSAGRPYSSAFSSRRSNSRYSKSSESGSVAVTPRCLPHAGRAVTARRIGTWGMPSSRNSGPVTEKPSPRYHPARWACASSTHGPSLDGQHVPHQHGGEPLAAALAGGDHPADAPGPALVQDPDVGHRPTAGLGPPDVAGGGLVVPAVDLGVGALLLDDEDVDAQPQQAEQRGGVEAGERPVVDQENRIASEGSSRLSSMMAARATVIQ